MFAQDWDEGLDEAQLAAVTHGDGPLAVLAGAGTGKTRVLTARVARLLERGVLPERVLLVTFTRRAADEMLARAAALVGAPGLAARLRGGTFHAVAHQVVAAYGEALGVPEGFSILDAADAAAVMDLLRVEHGLTGRGERAPRAATIVEAYSRCVNTGRPLSQVVAAAFPWCADHLDEVAAVCRAYVQHKRERGQLDLDDLLLYLRAATADDRLRPVLAGGLDHLLVDESQDLNALQVEIVRNLRPDGRGLTVVGDDAQAIYGFRGADPTRLLELVASLPGASTIRLERNCRSVQPVLDLANAVRPSQEPAGSPAALPPLVLRARRQGGRRPRLVRCHDAGLEAKAVVDRILERHEGGRRLEEQAVLVRAAHHSDLVELELTARKVPYRKHGGLRFLEAAHVKDLTASLRLLENPSDDLAWLRLLRLHDGVGPASARRLLETLPPRRATSAPWAETVAAAPPATRLALAATLAGLGEAAETDGVGRRVARVLELLRPLVHARYHDAGARLCDLERLAAAAGAREDLGGFLAELVLDPPASTSAPAGRPHLDEDHVVVSTVHSAKGLEWPVVHLPHLVDGAFPSDMALRSPDGLAEEARLFYVALTRARDEVLLYCPLRMPHHRHARDDRHSFAPTSRFLDGPAADLVQVEEAGPPRTRWQVTGIAPSRAPADLGLDRLWG